MNRKLAKTLRNIQLLKENVNDFTHSAKVTKVIVPAVWLGQRKCEKV